MSFQQQHDVSVVSLYSLAQISRLLAITWSIFWTDKRHLRTFLQILYRSLLANETNMLRWLLVRQWECRKRRGTLRSPFSSVWLYFLTSISSKMRQSNSDNSTSLLHCRSDALSDELWKFFLSKIVLTTAVLVWMSCSRLTYNVHSIKSVIPARLAITASYWKSKIRAEYVKCNAVVPSVFAWCIVNYKSSPL